MTDSRFSSRPFESSLSARSSPGGACPRTTIFGSSIPTPRHTRPLSGSTARPRSAADTGPRSAQPVAAGLAAAPRRARPRPSRSSRIASEHSPARSTRAWPRPWAGRYEGTPLEAPLASLSSSLVPLATRGASSEHDERRASTGPRNGRRSRSVPCSLRPQGCAKSRS